MFYPTSQTHAYLQPCQSVGEGTHEGARCPRERCGCPSTEVPYTWRREQTPNPGWGSWLQGRKSLSCWGCFKAQGLETPRPSEPSRKIQDQTAAQNCWLTGPPVHREEEEGEEKEEEVNVEEEE